jgi:hypothetical protein
MNEHIRASHIGHGTISKEEFERLDMVLGSKIGRHKSYVEHSNRPALILDSGFRSESLFESRVGLLKSCVFHDGEEEQCVVNATFFSPEEAYSAQVIAIFARADHLCKQIGSTSVRHQLMRNDENSVSAKVFHPVTRRTSVRYAINVIHSLSLLVICQNRAKCQYICSQVTEFVYFCSKASASWRTLDSLSILLQVHIDENEYKTKALTS